MNPREPAAFVAIRADDAPAAWRNVPEGSHLAIELPDFPISWAYLRWHWEQPSDGLVAIVVSAREQWADRTELRAAVIRSLLHTGRPVPVWVYVSQA